ncbi:YncE family protein [Pseudomonas shirazensis]
MKRFNKLFLTIVLSSAFFVSCSNDDDNTQEPRGDYDGGVFVVNEGQFGLENGSISYLSDDLEIENNVFTLVNPGKVTGDVVQCIGFNGDLAYIVVNFSNKIEVVNRYTFKSVATITAKLNNPRYIAFANGKGYVTNWGDGVNTEDDYVGVLDLTSNSITSTIPVVEGPEKIIENDGKLYVTHKGGYNFGNSLTVINASNNTVVTNFVVGDIPTAVAKDNGSLYVLCEGNPSYAETETAGKIVKVNLSNNTVASTINFEGKTHPGFLDIESSKIYYTVAKNVYSMSTTATALPTAPVFAAEVSAIYGLTVKNNKIYVADNGNRQDAGKIKIYSLTGSLAKTQTVGVSPNGFYFNN